MTPFLHRVVMSKLFYSHSVDFNCVSMALSNFVKGPIRSNTIH